MVVSNISSCDILLIYENREFLIRKKETLSVNFELGFVSFDIIPKQKSKLKVMFPFSGIHSMLPSDLSGKLVCSLHVQMKNIQPDSLVQIYDISTISQKGISFVSVGVFPEENIIIKSHYQINNLAQLLKKMRKISFLLSGLPIWIAILFIIPITNKFELIFCSVVFFVVSVVICFLGDKNLKECCTNDNANKSLDAAMNEKNEDIELLKDLYYLKNSRSKKDKLLYKISEYILKKW